MTPQLHILKTAHGDNIVLAMYGIDKVYLRGAERSMGRKWCDGKYTAKEARELWEQVIFEGGSVIDIPMLNQLLSMIMAESEIDLSLKVSDLEKQIESMHRVAEYTNKRLDDMMQVNKEMTRWQYIYEDQIAHLKDCAAWHAMASEEQTKEHELEATK